MQVGKPETLNVLLPEAGSCSPGGWGFASSAPLTLRVGSLTVGGCPGHCKAMSRVQGLQLLDASGASTRPNLQQSNMSPDVVSILNLRPDGRRRGIETVPVARGDSGLIPAWGGGYIRVCAL